MLKDYEHIHVTQYITYSEGRILAVCPLTRALLRIPSQDTAISVITFPPWRHSLGVPNQSVAAVVSASYRSPRFVAAGDKDSAYAYIDKSTGGSGLLQTVRNPALYDWFWCCHEKDIKDDAEKEIFFDNWPLLEDDISWKRNVKLLTKLKWISISSRILNLVHRSIKNHLWSNIIKK